MQSPHFDATAYQNAIYGSTSNFDSGTLKLHHASYTGETDASCYSNYVSQGLQPVQGYGCRDPPAYPESPSFFHTSGIMPNFGNAGYYKMPNRQMDLTDYGGTAMITRQQENFLMKPPDPVPLPGSPESYSHSTSNTTTNNVQNDRLHHHHAHNHHHHPPPHHHHQHQQQQPATTYEDGSQNLETNKLMHDTSIYGHSTVKLENMKMEPIHSQTEYDKSLNSSSPSTTIPPRSLHQENKTTTSPAPKCDRIPTEPSNKYTDNTNDTGSQESSMESSEIKTDSEEKKEDEASGDSKPTMSYIALIAKAILESEQRRLNLGSIYNWIEKHYPFYKNKGQGWRNSVRHNLSLNDCFIKAGRCEDGKGNYWAIHPANIQDFMRGDFRQRRRSRRRGRKKECDLSMYHVPNGYIQAPSAPLASGMTFNPAALSSIYSPYTEAERRAYRLDEALLRQSMNNPFVKWYQQGVSTPSYGVSTTPPTCNTGVYPNSTPVQWPQAYTDANTQAMYPALNSTFPR